MKITFYKNGYEILGHMNPLSCGEVSAMTYFCNGLILDNDEKAITYNGDNKGYTGIVFDIANEWSIYLYNRLKEDLKEWADNNFPKIEYEIIYSEKNLSKEGVELQAKKINLY